MWPWPEFVPWSPAATAEVGRNDPAPPEGHLGKLGSRRVYCSGTERERRKWGEEEGGFGNVGSLQKRLFQVQLPQCKHALDVTSWERLASDATRPWAPPAPLGTHLPARWSTGPPGSPCARRSQLGSQVNGHPIGTGPGTAAQCRSLRAHVRHPYQNHPSGGYVIKVFFFF